MKKFLLILIIFSSFLSLFLSCDDSTGPPNNNAKINLTLEDVSCTEVWLKLQVDNPALKRDVIIYRDNIEIKRINNILSNDTIIFDEGLLPDKEYTYQAKKIISEKEHIASEEIKAQTMDTTSHNFTFETYTFGEHSSSVLYDVAIIDENNIWAVGEIYMNDSLGNPDPIFYNLAVWDGQKWNLRKVYYKYINYLNQQDSIVAHLRTIFVFNENDIWLGIGNIIRWDGKRFISIDIPNNAFNSRMNKIWGTSSNDLYVVGNSGSIAHYQNGVWRKIESGTELPIRDIYGSKNKNNQFEILCVADSYGSTEGSKVLLIKDGIVYELWNDGLPYGLDAIWFISNRKYYVVGDGLWETRIPNINWIRQYILPPLHKTSIKGQNLNDIVVGGAFWLLAHYNGLSWQTYFPMISGSFTSVEINDNIIIAVGGIDRKAVVVFGRR